jgi:hypothetical protein
MLSAQKARREIEINNPIVALYQNRNVIPPLTDPACKNWRQPTANNILIDDVNALMSEDDFNQLTDYSSYKLDRDIQPYVGKMFKRKVKDHWQLVWYSYDPEPKWCKNNYRIIIII